MLSGWSNSTKGAPKLACSSQGPLLVRSVQSTPKFVELKRFCCVSVPSVPPSRNTVCWWLTPTAASERAGKGEVAVQLSQVHAAPELTEVHTSLVCWFAAVLPPMM